MAEAFDTLTTSEDLQKCGLSEVQSKGIARAINGAIAGNLATKSDIDNLDKKIDASAKYVTSDVKLFVMKTVISTGAGLFIALKASQYFGF